MEYTSNTTIDQIPKRLYLGIPKQFFCGITLFILFTFFAEALNAQSINVSVDPATEYQTIDGFGASDAWRCQFVGKNWPEAKKNRIAELLFSQKTDEKGNPLGIGLSLWRFYISAGTAEQGDASDILNEWRRGDSFIDKKGNYDWTKQEGQQWFLKKAKAAGVEKFLAFSIAAPTFWSIDGKGYANTKGGKMNLKEEHYGDYANFMVEILDHFKAEGLPFDYLSPINEPQWDWERPSQEGTPATNENIAALIKDLNSKISEKAVQTQIVIPEAADLRFLYSDYGKPERGDQIKNFFAEAEGNNQTYIGNLDKVKKTVSGHSYFTTWPVDSLISIREKLAVSLKKNNTDYWQSEFCILEKNDDIGQGGQRDLGMGTALYVARVIHADLTLANAKSWQWWTALTIADFKDGLIYLDTGNKDNMYDREALKNNGEFHDSKLLWALGNYSRFIRPGMQRIKADLEKGPTKESYNDLMISGYKDPKTDRVVFVAVNYSNEEKIINLDGKNLQLEKMYETSTDKNLEMSAISSNKVDVPPRSVVTLTGRLETM